MALPDVIVRVLSSPTPAERPTNTAQAFRTGQSQRGWEKKPRLCRSMSDFALYFGVRLSTSTLWDWAETFFAEGGTELWLKSAKHSDAVVAKLELKKSAAVSLVVKAGSMGEVEPGTWGNGLKVAVLAVTGGYTLQVQFEGVVVEESPTCVTQSDAVAWATGNSNYIVVSLGAGTEAPEAAATAALTSGAAGATVTDADHETAEATFSKELGPGQITIEGTSESRLKIAMAHAVANNRFALLETADSGSSATLIAAAQALYTAPSSGRRYGQLAAPWDVIPGLVAGTTRTVPPTARLAAQYARVDALGNPNQAAAGKNGRAQYVIELSQPNFTEAERLALNNAGVTLSRRRFGNTIATWGLRNLADQVNDESWSQASNVRCLMAYIARAEAVLEEYEFDQIDGFGHLQGEVAGALTGIASEFLTSGALYGKTPEEAFAINVGEALNPPKAIEEGKLTTESALRVSKGAEQIIARIIKVPVSGTV